MAEEDVAKKDADATASGGIKGMINGLITKVTSSKKMMIITGGGILLVLIIIGGGAYYFLSQEDSKDEILTKDSSEDSDEKIEKSKEDETTAKFESVHIFSLNSFFLPITLKNNKESGHFLLVTPKFRMSNSNLNSEINKKLPLIREKMYSILRREKLKDLTENIGVVQKRIKGQFRDRTNELLPVGSGVVKEVFFSEFVIK